MTCKGEHHVFFEPGPCVCGRKFMDMKGRIRDHQEAGK